MTTAAFRNPFAVIAAILAILVLGFSTVLGMPLDNFPEINIPVVMVATFYQGFSPEEMDRAITSRIERAFTQASHLDHIEAKSYNGVSLIKVFFEPGVDVGSGESELISLENTVLRKLPRGIQPSTFLRFDVSNVPVCQVVVHSKERTEAQLYDLAQFTIRQQLASIPGAAVWPSFGGKYRQIVVQLDRDALEAQRLTAFDLVHAINASNLILPGGNANVGNLNVEVQANTQIPLVSEIDQIPLRVGKDGSVVYVKDVAHTVDGSAIQTNAVQVNGKRAVVIPVGKAIGGNTIQIVDGVKAMLSRLIGVPDDVRLDVVFDQSQYIRGALRSLAVEAGIGSLLAALFMWLVFGSIRAMVGVVIAIPLCLLASLIGLAALHQTLNSMTLGGVELSIGLLVTNAVVVLENTFRHMDLGKSPAEASLEGARELSVPMLVSTVSVLLVFMPLQLLSGISRFLFVPLGLTVSLAMGASYLLAMALMPVYGARFLRARTEANTPRLTRQVDARLEDLEHRYRTLLEWVFAHRKRTLALAAGVWLASLPLVFVVGLEFFPHLDFGEILLSVHAPAGSNLEETERIVSRIQDRIRAVVPPSDLRMAIANIGLPQGFNSIFSANAGADRATVQVQLTPADERSVSSDTLIQRLRTDISRHVPVADIAYRPSGIVTGVVNSGLPVPIDLQIYGPDSATQERVAREVIDLVRAVPGTTGTRLAQNLAEPYLDVNVDRKKAGLLGLDEQSVTENLITSLSSNLFLAPSYWLDPKTGNDYFLVVQSPEKDISSLASIQTLPVTARDRAPNQLKNLAQLENRTGPQEVDQMNLRPVLDVETDLVGRDLGAVASDIRARLAHLSLPPKTRVKLSGQADTLDKASAGFGFGLGFAAVLVFLVMAALFGSFLEPLSVLGAILMSLVGVLWALFIGRSTLNVQSMLGVMMLMGLVAYHGILLVSTAQRRLRAGRDPQTAMLEAGEMRLRPTLMAVAATLLGLLPAALRSGMHAEPNTALAQALIGGLLVGVAAIFLILPVLWAFVSRPFDLLDHDAEAMTVQPLGEANHASLN